MFAPSPAWKCGAEQPLRHGPRARIKWNPYELDQFSPSMLEEVLNELGRIGNTLGDAPAPTVKGLLGVFVESAVADLDTRNLEFVFRLPSWAAIEPSKICAGASLRTYTGSDTNFCNFIILKQISCLWSPEKRGRGGHKGFYTIIERLGKAENQSETSQVESEPNDLAAV